jgi:hypothetical protein
MKEVGRKNPLPQKAPSKLKAKISQTGQHFMFPIESPLTQEMKNTVRSPIGIMTRTKFNSENKESNQTQSYDSRFKKQTD